MRSSAWRLRSGRNPPAVDPPETGGLGGTAVRLGLVAGLAWLTYSNATTSKALDEAIAAEGRGDYPNAVRAAIEHLDRRPWSFEASRLAARCLSRLDFPEEAESYYRRAWNLTVNDLLYRAYGLTRANLRERAVEAFDEILRRDPGDVAALRLKAGLLLSMTRWEEVAAIGRRLAASTGGPVEVDAPVSTAGHWTLKPMAVRSVEVLGATLEAVAYHNQGKVQDAISAYERVLKLDPDLRSMPLDRRLFWAQYGEDLLSMGRASDVIRLLGLVDEGRSDAAMVALVARAHMQQGSVDESEACWRRVMDLDPEHAAAGLNLGRIELGRDHPDEAARLLLRAASLAPDSVDAAYNLGLTYRRLGQAAEARKWEEEVARRRHRRDEKGKSPAAGETPASTGPLPGSGG